jgi:hypothetical protein
MMVVNVRAYSPASAASDPVPPPLPSASHHQNAREGCPDEKRPVAVWVFINTAKEVGDIDHLKVFASEDAASVGSSRTIPRAWRSNIW